MDKKTKILIYLAVLSGGVLLISNISATKLWNFFGIAVDGGIIMFPLSYIIGDLVIEFSDKKTASRVILASFGLNVLAITCFYIVGRLPAYPGWDNQDAYDAILGFTPRIVAGSLTAYAVSSFLNNFVFVKIRQKTGEKWFSARALGSSIVAHFVDSFLFETIAFIGVLTFKEFLKQAVFAYIASLILETLLYPLTNFSAKRIRHFLLS